MKKKLIITFSTLGAVAAIVLTLVIAKPFKFQRYEAVDLNTAHVNASRSIINFQIAKPENISITSSLEAQTKSKTIILEPFRGTTVTTRTVNYKESGSISIVDYDKGAGAKIHIISDVKLNNTSVSKVTSTSGNSETTRKSENHSKMHLFYKGGSALYKGDIYEKDSYLESHVIEKSYISTTNIFDFRLTLYEYALPGSIIFETGQIQHSYLWQKATISAKRLKEYYIVDYALDYNAFKELVPTYKENEETFKHFKIRVEYEDLMVAKVAVDIKLTDHYEKSEMTFAVNKPLEVNVPKTTDFRYMSSHPVLNPIFTIYK